MNATFASPVVASEAAAFDIKTILNLDDFDQFRARASSGGSVYGMLRRQAFLRGPGKTAAGGPAARPMQRQRSRSLIQRSVALPEDKSILKMLCDYSEKKKLMKENRRHSEAALSFNHRENSARQRVSPVRLHRTLTPKYGRGAAASSIPSSSVSVPTKVPEEEAVVTQLLLPPPVGIGGVVQEPLKLSAAASPAGSSPSSSGAVPAVPPPPPPAARNICRRRSFSLTQHGLVVNDGDEVVTLPTSPGTSLIPTNAFDGCVSTVPCGPAQRSRAASVFSPEAAQLYAAAAGRAAGSRTSISGDTPMHRVLMLGGPGVGKTALTQQFVTSEYMAAQNTSFDDGIEIPIPVMLDGEVSIIEFIDLPYNGELNTWQEYDVDGYIIVYSITDRRSYQKAADLLYNMKGGDPCLVTHHNKPIIVAANKSDLERSRIISKQEGRTIAETYGSKYIDVSAILNHKVDDLLVGILKQIRLSRGETNRAPRTRQHSRDDSSDVVGCFVRPKGSLFTRIVRRSSRRRHSRSCENLLSL